ncbi:3-deoxy-D-manno-octulosonic acid transferase [Phenylobacterium sp.]|uniref:3-deoxy-D-manno-octulosonic acid transferase n=1 Tax=Phenylobacterium sp. TaxID=1871053 RepID=UPI002DF33A5B|nr:3-deoxy-D-manno-octulosonic acid transferase [Phenylobacterium sp.]
MTLRPLPLALYAAATGLMAPFAPALLRSRARGGKEDPARLGERLGRAGRPRPPGPLVWLHGVSVGETQSLLPLVAALRARRPDLALLVTSGTRTAAELLGQRLPEGVIHQFAPLDTPGAVAGFLDHWRPGAGVLVESELWPNLILAAKARGVRLALLSARMTEDSARGWARSPASARTLMGAFDLVLPQDASTAERLASLGAAVGPQLNLKLLGEPLPCDTAELQRLTRAIGGRRVVLAASTHPGEEPTIALAALEQAGADLLILAPRHPERGAALAQELARFAPARRSLGQPIAGDTRIYLADTLGEMGLFLRLADVVVMGGSFVAGVGGHNPLEAARLGKPILTGPHVANARSIYDQMYVEVAALEAANAEHLARHIRGLLDNPMIARRIGEAALSYAERQGAALDRALALLDPLLPA